MSKKEGKGKEDKARTFERAEKSKQERASEVLVLACTTGHMAA
jgi:hypothetical protein